MKAAPDRMEVFYSACFCIILFVRIAAQNKPHSGLFVFAQTEVAKVWEERVTEN